VPGGGDTAVLSSFGGAVSGTGSVDTLYFTASLAAWTLFGQITANTSTVDSTLSVSAGGLLFVKGPLYAARAGGVIATINVSGSGAQLIEAPQAAGTVSYVGAGGTINGIFSSGGNGYLNVNSRGIATFGSALRLGSDGTTGTATIDAGVLSVGGVFQLGTGSSVSNGTGNLVVQNGGQVVVSAAADASTSYLQLGATAGTGGFAQVNGSNSLLFVTSNSGAVGLAGTGALSVANGGAARFATSNNGPNPALSIGVRAGASGTVNVAGAGSTLVATGTLTVGSAGSGTLRILAGASATSSSFADAQAALSVAAAPGGTGSVAIDGAGSQLVASGQAVIGGDNRGSGFGVGGRGTVAVTGGGTLQTTSMTIQPGSQVSVDGASTAVIIGNLNDLGVFASSGTLAIVGTLTGAGSLQLGGGFTDIGGVSGASMAFTAPNATLRLHALTDASTVSGIQYGDLVDLVGIGVSGVRLSGNTVTTTTGTLNLGAASAGSQYQLTDDGNGGTYISLTGDTIGVFRFFDSNYGTHFFSASPSERNTIISTRPDLVYEGVGLQSVDPASNDPNSAPVYRFFDSTYGTHFFTASASERDTVIQTRSDLLYEGTGFLEHTQQQAGDIAVYRFFDTHFGTHFYTADAGERATVAATRPDLIDEGIGFYAPAQP
jgi:T5SS/PEP-CTERM-associated repeat protein